MPTPIKGRGALSQPPGRFERHQVQAVDDGWSAQQDPLDSRVTSVEPESARSIIATNDSPDVPFEQSINPYRGCEHGCVYCLGGETRILMADGRCKALAEVRVGDEIYGTERRGCYRRYVRTQVLAHWRTVKPALRIALVDGTELIASGDHRFLTDGGWKFVAPDGELRPRPSLTLNDRLMGFGTVRNKPRWVKSSADLSVAEIAPVGRPVELFDITTGTGDFVANGVISHNCYARPSHSFVGLSPGLDFETKLFYKADAAGLLERALARPGYVCKPIALGSNTDPYQPVERRLKVTRSLLEVFVRHRHPVSIVTKGTLIERDIDLLADLARDRLATVMLSLPTLEEELKRTLEPRAASPRARLRVMAALRAAAIPVGVMVAPVIPAITDHELERILEVSRDCGASRAAYTLLRLPYEVKDLFREWLAAHRPGQAAHVMSLVRQQRGDRDNDPSFGTRMRGTGPLAELLHRRFEVACRRLGLNSDRGSGLELGLFRPPHAASPQLDLPW